MTERFKYNPNTCLIELITDSGDTNELSSQSVVEWLNHLYDENMQLHQSLRDVKSIEFRKLHRIVERLKKEKKELKQENDALKTINSRQEVLLKELSKK